MRNPTIGLVDDATLGVWALLDAVAAGSDEDVQSLQVRSDEDSGGSPPRVVEYDSGTIRRLRRPELSAAPTSLLSRAPTEGSGAIGEGDGGDVAAGALESGWG